MSPRTTRRRRANADDRGQVLIFVALAMTTLLGLVAFASDFGYILYARQALQASSDAAATAGAQDIGVTGGNPTSRATQYSSVTGNKNARANLPNVTISSSLKCVNSTGLPTCTSPAVNTIVVTQTATLPLFFARVIGITSKTITAKATATMRGGAVPPLDVMIILDASYSMKSDCDSSVSGVWDPSKLDCAKAGIKELLLSLWPCADNLVSCGTADSTGNVNNPIDKVGLIVFPPLKSSGHVSRMLDCTDNLDSDDVAFDNPSNKSVDPNYTYVIVNPLSNFKTSATATTLNATSNLVKAIDVDDCGVESEGMSTSFSTAFQKAQAALTTYGRSTVRDVIIFVSDGQANYGPVYTDTATSSPETSAYRKQPCQSTVDLADGYATAGTWIYSVMYDGSGDCQGWNTSQTFHKTSRFDRDESPRISATTTMRNIASELSKYYNQPNPGSLSAIFQKIAADLHTTRIVDDDIP
jgi:Flp pilus assembly protein TadG